MWSGGPWAYVGWSYWEELEHSAQPVIVVPGPVKETFLVKRGTRSWYADRGGLHRWYARRKNQRWGAPMPGELDSGVIYHVAGSTEDYEFDFGDLPQYEADLTISNQTVTASPSGLTITGVTAVNNYRVTFRVAGGTAGTDYVFTCTVTWSNSTVTVRKGTLRVE